MVQGRRKTTPSSPQTREQAHQTARTRWRPVCWQAQPPAAARAPWRAMEAPVARHTQGQPGRRRRWPAAASHRAASCRSGPDQRRQPVCYDVGGSAMGVGQAACRAGCNSRLQTGKAPPRPCNPPVQKPPAPSRFARAQPSTHPWQRLWRRACTSRQHPTQACLPRSGCHWSRQAASARGLTAPQRVARSRQAQGGGRC